MLKYFESNIFFICLGEKKEKIVGELLDSLKNDAKYDPVRDKVDLGYKGLISDFMKTIGKGSFVVVVLSDKYFRSVNIAFLSCMNYTGIPAWIPENCSKKSIPYELRN